MFKNIVKFYLPSLVVVLFAVCIGILVWQFVSPEYLLSDIGGVGLFINVLGTVYTLISAFIVAEVWRQFNDMGGMLAEEAKALSSIWNYANYLNDEGFSKKLRDILTKYIDRLLEVEMKEASKVIRSTHPSGELTELHTLVDTVKFDDSRDSSVYSLIASAFETLSSIRAKRIEAGISRVPSFLKSLLVILSFMLVGSFVFLGFNSIYLYLIVLAFVTFISVVIYKVVSDLDNPWEGIWNIDTTMLHQTKKYIEESKHNK